VAIIIIAIGLASGGFFLYIYNRFQACELRQGGLSGIDVQLKKRHDLIPLLVETVKGYCISPKETFFEVITSLRNRVCQLSLKNGDS